MTRRRQAALAAAFALAAAVAACHREAPADMKEPGRTPADATYRTRGVVYQLPAAPGGELVVFHEAVPEFVDRKGERSGMDSMSMPFAIPEEVSLDGVEKGDKVEIAFEVRWKGAPTLVITELRELAPDTELQLGRGTADPSTDAPAPEVTPSPAAAEDAESEAPNGGGAAI